MIRVELVYCPLYLLEENEKSGTSPATTLLYVACIVVLSGICLFSTCVCRLHAVREASSITTPSSVLRSSSVVVEEVAVVEEVGEDPVTTCSSIKKLVISKHEIFGACCAWV